MLILRSRRESHAIPVSYGPFPSRGNHSPPTDSAEEPSFPLVQAIHRDSFPASSCAIAEQIGTAQIHNVPVRNLGACITFHKNRIRRNTLFPGLGIANAAARAKPVLHPCILQRMHEPCIAVRIKELLQQSEPVRKTWLHPQAVPRPAEPAKRKPEIGTSRGGQSLRRLLERIECGSPGGSPSHSMQRVGGRHARGRSAWAESSR